MQLSEISRRRDRVRRARDLVIEDLDRVLGLPTDIALGRLLGDPITRENLRIVLDDVECGR